MPRYRWFGAHERFFFTLFLTRLILRTPPGFKISIQMVESCNSRLFLPDRLYDSTTSKLSVFDTSFSPSPCASYVYEDVIHC